MKYKENSGQKLIAFSSVSKRGFSINVLVQTFLHYFYWRIQSKQIKLYRILAS